MRLARVAFNQLDRVSSGHALLLSCACFAILLFSFPATRSHWLSIGWTNSNSGPDEARLDAVLQQAAITALAGREGTIIIMDARTGQPYFLVRIGVDRAMLRDYPDARIIPGMPVQIELQTGSHTALDYLIEPVRDVMHKGMREK